jgi:hypothetical protein
LTTSKRIGLLLPLLAGVVLTSCSSAAPAAAPTTAPATPAQQALVVYERYWTVTEAAFAAPGARDWAPELQGVATGSALESASRDVRNYADFPAHTEGAISRAPSVGATTDGHIEIVDCVDLGDSRLVADRTGEILDDLVNRVPRYRFRADVVLHGEQWLVERTEPALDEPC